VLPTRPDPAKIRYGGIGRRAVALLIDFGIVLLACQMIEWLLEGGYMLIGWVAARAGGAVWPSYEDAWNPLAMEVFETLLLVVVGWPWFITIPLRRGATPGKAWLGLEIRQAVTFAPVTRGQLIRRFLGYPVSIALFFCGFLMAIFHPRRRTVQDWLAGTVVVLRRSIAMVAVGAILGSGAQASTPSLGASWFHDSPWNGVEVQGSLPLAPWRDRWIYVGPRLTLQYARGSGDSRTRAFAGVEGIVWMANAIGPGLAVDWQVGNRSFRFEPSLGTRLGALGLDGAWSIRLGFPLQAAEGWGFKLGATFELGGVP
jgi:uncharacterized RDD family membrane protein YckC